MWGIIGVPAERIFRRGIILNGRKIPPVLSCVPVTTEFFRRRQPLCFAATAGCGSFAVERLVFCAVRRSALMYLGREAPAAFAAYMSAYHRSSLRTMDAPFAGARDSGDAFLCRFLGKVSVVGRGDDVAVGSEQSEPDLTLFVGVDLPFREFELFPLLQSLIFYGSGGGVVAHAVDARLAVGDGGVKPCAYSHNSVVGRVELVDEVALVRLFDDEFPVGSALVACLDDLLGGFRVFLRFCSGGSRFFRALFGSGLGFRFCSGLFVGGLCRRPS